MKSQFAFTLIEALVALSIIAILMAISIPALREFSARAEDSRLCSQLQRTLQHARSEAHARNAPIALCGSSDHVSCDDDWLNGQIIFVDENEDGIVHDKSQIISVIQSQHQRGVLQWRAFPHYREYVQFTLSENDNTAFWYCRANTPQWAVMLSKYGNIHVVYPNKHGVIKDVHGNVLKCGG